MLNLGYFAAAGGLSLDLSFEFGSDNAIGTNSSLYTFSNRAVGPVATEPEQRRYIVVYLTHMGNNSGAQVVPNYVRFDGVDMEMLDFINGAGNGGTSSSFWIIENNASTIGTVAVSLAASSGRCGITIWSVYSGPYGVETREVTKSTSTTAAIGPALVEPGDVVLTGAANLAGGSARTISGGYMDLAGSRLVENTSYMAWANKAESNSVVAPDVTWSTPSGSDSRSCMLVVLKPKAPPTFGINLEGSYESAANATSYTYADAPLGDPISGRGIIVVAMVGGTGRFISGVTLGGVPMQEIVQNNNGDYNPGIYYLDQPAGVTADIVVSGGGGTPSRGTIDVYSIYKHNPTSVDNGQAAQTGSSNNLSMNLNIAAGGLGLFHSTSNLNSTTYTWDAPAIKTLDISGTGGETGSRSQALREGGAGGIISQGYTMANSQSHLMVGASWEPGGPPEGLPLDAILISPQAGTVSANKNYTMNIGTAAADRLVVIHVGQDTNYPSGCTINGVTAQLIKQTTYVTASTTVYAAFVPTGDGNVTVNVTSAGTPKRQTVAGWIIYGAQSETPDVISNELSLSGTNGDMSVSMPKTGGILIGCATSGAGNSFTWTGLTERFDTTVGTTGVSGAADGSVPFGVNTVNVRQATSTYLTAFLMGWVK